MAATTNGKSKKQSRVVTLKLPPAVLNQFTPDSKLSSSSPSTPSTPLHGSDEPASLKPVASMDNASDSNSTPVPSQDLSGQGDGSKKRKTPSAAPRKSLNAVIDTMPKPRGKPGPKKKPRLEDGTIDHNAKAPVVVIAGHKLGPKANTGAINAGLRALDRTGTPCRKWDRKGFQLKSFTGIVWEVSTWKGGENSALSKHKDGESTSDTKDVSMQSSSDVKANGSDIAMSNAGDNPDAMAVLTPAASSPAPTPGPAVVAAHG